MRAGAVRAGNRRRRRGMLAVGVVLLMVAVAGAAAMGVMTARGFNWYRVMPQWMLERQAVAGGSDEAGATEELAARLSKGEVDAERAARLVARGLAVQADASRPWLKDWGRMVETARTEGRITDAVWEQYLRNAFPLEVVVSSGNPGLLSQTPAGQAALPRQLSGSLGPARLAGSAGAPVIVALVLRRVELRGTPLPLAFAGPATMAAAPDVLNTMTVWGFPLRDEDVDELETWWTVSVQAGETSIEWEVGPVGASAAP